LVTPDPPRYLPAAQSLAATLRSMPAYVVCVAKYMYYARRAI